MKRQDLYIFLGFVTVFLPFFLSKEVYDFYITFNKGHGLITAFIKFAVLATFGEALGLRIREGVYNRKGFGLLPRAAVWGFLGITIKVAFVIFASGTPKFLEYAGMKNATEIFTGDLSVYKIFVAFSISAALNLIYAPVMMTLHKITDIHIVANSGKLKCLLQKIHFAENFKQINWDVQWHFIYKKTIPLFWIPAHTITFLLPTEFQVLFAALLGIALGTILAFASLKK
ncbi:MAG: Mpv17/PMP22 family protein [Chlorobi bacterium]|nr:Mpv17/PMP22 family protein [Chlorobiota bacterium]